VAEYGQMVEAAIHILFPFLLGAAMGMLRVGRILQRVDHVAKTQEQSDVKNSAAHDKLFTGLESLRRDVNGSIGKLNEGLVRVDTRVETLPCQPKGIRQPPDCTGSGP
jgi:hypothetical protein